MYEGKQKGIPISDLKDMLSKTGKQYPEKIAYKIKKKDGNYETITHKEVRKKIDALGTSLISMGLKDKRIAVIGENRYEWEIAYLAIVCGTGIVVPLDKSLPEKELENLIKRSQIEAIVYSQKYEETLKRMKLQGVGKLKHLISMDLEEHQDGIYSQKELIEKGEKLIEEGNLSFLNSKIDGLFGIAPHFSKLILRILAVGFVNRVQYPEGWIRKAVTGSVEMILLIQPFCDLVQFCV